MNSRLMMIFPDVIQAENACGVRADIGLAWCWVPILANRKRARSDVSGRLVWWLVVIGC